MTDRPRHSEADKYVRTDSLKYRETGYDSRRRSGHSHGENNFDASLRHQKSDLGFLSFLLIIAVNDLSMVDHGMYSLTTIVERHKIPILDLQDGREGGRRVRSGTNLVIANTTRNTTGRDVLTLVTYLGSAMH
jgi:hypothetical protein